MTDRRSITSAENGKLGGRPRASLAAVDQIDGELWKPIEGYDKYMVSNMGRVLSSQRGKLRLLNPARTGRNHKKEKSYRAVSLSGGTSGKPKLCTVHRLVLMAFKGPCPEGYEGSHLNGDPSDNRLSNLEWESRKQNQYRRHEHGTRAKGEDSVTAKLSNAHVKEIRELSQLKENTNDMLAEKYGVSNALISYIKNGKYRTE